MFLIHHIMLKSQQEDTRGHLWPFENTSMQNKYISRFVLYDEYLNCGTMFVNLLFQIVMELSLLLINHHQLNKLNQID